MSELEGPKPSLFLLACTSRCIYFHSDRATTESLSAKSCSLHQQYISIQDMKGAAANTVHLISNEEKITLLVFAR
jgi:beta-galactosidase beta subunit